MHGVLLAQAPKINQNYIQNLLPWTKHFGTVGDVVNALVPVATVGAGIILVCMFIYTGFLYINSQGNPETIKKVQKLLTWSIIGFVLVIISFILVRFLYFLFRLQGQSPV